MEGELTCILFLVATLIQSGYALTRIHDHAVYIADILVGLNNAHTLFMMCSIVHNAGIAWRIDWRALQNI